MRLTILGGGGWIPTAVRETCCYAIRRDDELLVLDAGSGMRRLLERPDIVSGTRSIAVVLTHFHLDHVVGLGYLPGIARPEAVTIWAPGSWLYHTPSTVLLERLLGPPFFSAGIPAVASRVAELEEGRLACGAFSVRARRQIRHSEPTAAIRVDDRVTYCTDTAYDPDNVEFARSTRVLLHEAWHPTTATDDEMHSAAGEAARVAREADVGELVLIHVNPLSTDDDELIAPARREFARTRVAHDLDVLDLG